MALIKATDLGVRFKLSRYKNAGMLYTLKTAFKPPTDGKDFFWALKGLNFEVEHGDILGVIGSNGSGKSTLLRTIGGIYEPDQGTMEVTGTVSTLLSLGTGFKEDLSGLENIFLSGIIMGFTEKEIEEKVDAIVEFTELNHFIDEPVKVYSSGMKARLGFAIAVNLKREVMLVDEILGVGDFRFRNKSHEKMKELITDGRTVILVSHNLESIRAFSNKVLWINKGTQMAFGDPNEIIERYLKS